MSNQKEVKKGKLNTPKGEKLKMRQVIIETDGSNINIIKNETAGNLELVAMLSVIMNRLQNPQK